MDWYSKNILPLRDKLLGYADKIMREPEESEDIVQEVFITIWYKKEDLKRHPNVKALAYMMTRNLALNRKKVLSKRTGCDTKNFSYEYKFAEGDENEKLVKRIMEIVELLPSLQKGIFSLKHFEGFEPEEIAQITGSNVEAVRMNLSRARKRIRDIYFTTIKK